jgi:hypothetical protein
LHELVPIKRDQSRRFLIAAASSEAKMKSKKTPKATLKPKKKVKAQLGRKPDLFELYREIQWLRDLVAHFERAQRKSETN